MANATRHHGNSIPATSRAGTGSGAGELTIDVSDLGTVLGVWAHPDDETFLTAGLMALARAAGQRVVCATATRGEHGTADPDRWPPARLGRLREYELAAALAVLAVHEHTWLDFVDGGCATVPTALGARAVRQILDDVRPDTVVTFGRDGFTGHDDHRAVSGWVDEALAGHGRAVRLLHPTVTPAFTDRFGVLNNRFAVFGPGLPSTRSEDELALHLRLAEDVLDRKVAALRAQASQIGPLHDAVGGDAFRSWWGTEAFVLAPVAVHLAA
jgi:LmbE family N-acetylglucosaminyl deacetylase